MKRLQPELPREIYEFPEGKIRLINWREVAPMELGNWAGLHGEMETELIVCRETAGSKLTVMGRSVFYPGSFHDPHIHLSAEEFIYCLSGKAIAGGQNKEYLFTPGDVQFAAIGETHWLRNPFPEPLEFIWVYTGVSMPDESGYSTPDLFAAANTIVEKNEIPK
ncbi:MAG: cupin domain-containing protein [Atribacterota bacterium]